LPSLEAIREVCKLATFTKAALSAIGVEEYSLPRFGAVQAKGLSPLFWNL